MAAATRLSLKWEQGSRFVKTFRFLDEQLLPRDLTLFTPRMKIRPDYTSAPPTALPELREGLYLSNSLTGGGIRIEVPSDITSQLPDDSYVYDLELAPVQPETIGFAGLFTSVFVEVDAAAAVLGRITANGGTPFATIVVGNLIRMRNTVGGNDGTYKVLTQTSTVLEFTTVLAGVSVPADTQIVLERLVVDESNVEKTFCGVITMKKEATY